jgi:hypothetical protein
MKRHLDCCPLCQSHSLDDESIRAMGITPVNLQAELPLWPVPAACPKPQTLRLAWRYAFGLSLVVAMVWLAISVSHFAPTPSFATLKSSIREIEETDESKSFAVLSAKVGADSARSVIFKPRQTGLTIVWFEKI